MLLCLTKKIRQIHRWEHHQNHNTMTLCLRMNCAQKWLVVITLSRTKSYLKQNPQTRYFAHEYMDMLMCHTEKIRQIHRWEHHHNHNTMIRCLRMQVAHERHIVINLSCQGYYRKRDPQTQDFAHDYMDMLMCHTEKIRQIHRWEHHHNHNTMIRCLRMQVAHERHIVAADSVLSPPPNQQSSPRAASSVPPLKLSMLSPPPAHTVRRSNGDAPLVHVHVHDQSLLWFGIKDEQDIGQYDKYVC